MIVKKRLDTYADVEEQVSLKTRTTFRIGGNCRYFIYPKNEICFLRILQILKEENISWKIFGKGSNILCSDDDFDGAVICLDRYMSDFYFEEDGSVMAQAGCSIILLAHEAMKRSFSGLEFASGIPGTVGGAVYMNAGAYGGEMKDVLVSVTYLTREGEIVTEDAANLDLSYRHSIFEENGGCILSAKLHLKRGDSAAIKARMDELMQKRIDKQPLDKPSAGSTFKRPVGAFAAALIDQCGLRGYRHGGAAVSEKHCGFVVNLGGATCADVLALCDEVRAVVKEKTGYELEKEIRVVKA